MRADRNAPDADEACCTADWIDMKRARSRGDGTRVVSVLYETLRRPMPSMNDMKKPITGIHGDARTKKVSCTHRRISAPAVPTRNEPSRSTNRPPRRVAKKLTTPPPRYSDPRWARGK